MDTPMWLWSVTILGILFLIVMDFVGVSRKPHEVKFREAALGPFSMWEWPPHSCLIKLDFDR
jgi:hypothetical protein